MADPKGTDSKPTGPVKPPVLDLKAREASAGPSASKPAPDKDPAPSPKPAVAPPVVTPSRFALGAAVAGGVLGLAAAYGLAWFGLWPTPPAAPAPADPRLAQFASAIPELETVTQTTQAELATLNQRLGALESAEPAAPATATGEPADLSGVETDIAALAARIDRLSTAPAPTADTGAVDGLRAELIALTTRLDEVAARLGTAEAGLRSLDTTMTATTATLAEQPSDIGAVLQLPLILSGLDTAFATGRPYASELAALRAALPSAAIPTALANAATTGLARPDVIASRFANVLPAMLAGRPANPDAQWQDGALDWFRSAIALRPTGEIDGDSPEAVMSRLEGAIARRDFLSAESLLATLPAPMLAAAEDVPALVTSQAEAARFLDAVRANALSGEVKP
ncbi:COG4223 family protein [Devosia sp. A449]